MFIVLKKSLTSKFIYMYNHQSGMGGGDHPRPPLSLPNLPLPPDLPSLNQQEKALNLQVADR